MVEQPPQAGQAFDAQIQADLDTSRLRAHAGSTPLAAVAGLGVAALMVWALGPVIARPWLAAWAAALAAALVLRLALWRARWRSPLVERDVPRRLWGYRLAVGLHGAVWAASVWLPGVWADFGQQATMLFLLQGLCVGAMALTLFDLRASMMFVLPICASLAWRLATEPGPSAPHATVGLVMAILLIGMLSLAALRRRRERRALAVTLRTESDSARSAREAQVLLQQIFDHAGQGISVFDGQMRLRAWNALALQYSGADPEQARPGMPLREVLVRLAKRGVFGPVDADAEADRRLAMLADPDQAVARQLRSDGRLIETRRNPLPDGGIVLFQVDITDREAAQAALAEQQRKLDLVQARTLQGFWTIDNDLRTTDANPAMCRMLGLGREQLLGRGIYEFVDEANAAVFREHVQLRAAGQAEGYEITLTRADGQPVHCYNNATPLFGADGRKVGALGLFSDISAQKLAEQQARLAGEQLAQKSRLLEAMLDSLDQGILSVDAAGRCNAWNRRFLALVQIPESLMSQYPLLRDVRQYQHDHQHFGPNLEALDAAGREAVQRFQRGEPDSLAQRYQRRRADGTVVEVNSHFAADGSLVRTYTDVTEQRQAEAALIAARDEAERAREEAERANRAKSDFLSRMSHELRTPMNAVLGFGQLLEADAHDPLSNGQRQRVQALLKGGRHLLVLIDEVLDVARIEAGTLRLDLQPVGVATLAQDCLDLVQPVAQARGVSLHGLAPADDALLVQADPTRLRQVLLNLLSNAIKFNREGGAVHLRCQAEPGQVLLEVADEGPGIAPTQQPRLFQAFERLDADGAVEGTGIGLALSHSLVSLMHGQIGVRSTPGQGSVFWLRLPQPGGVPLLAGADAHRQAVAERPCQHVLYIEDNEVNQVLMAGMLAHRPAITLQLADDGERGLQQAAAQPPHLVLLDIQLPGIDGFEVLRQLRAMPALRATPVVAVSANAMPGDLEEARSAGFAAYLSKPVELQRLLALVDTMLAPPTEGVDAQVGW